MKQAAEDVFNKSEQELGNAFEDVKQNFQGGTGSTPSSWQFRWRDSSVGESTRFIPVVSGVRIPFPLLQTSEGNFGGLLYILT